MIIFISTIPIPCSTQLEAKYLVIYGSDEHGLACFLNSESHLEHFQNNVIKGEEDVLIGKGTW